MLDLKRLLIFTEVAQRGSFSAAADALNYTQPAISHQISRLELELGTRLLVRSTRGGVSLTESGQVLLPRARVLLSQASDLEADLAEFAGGSASQVRIGAFATASATFVADAIGELRHEDPSLRLTLVEGEAADTLEALRARAVDIAVVFDDAEHPIPKDKDFAFAHALGDPMLLALPRQHPLASRPAIRLLELADADWIEGAGRETAASLILVSACQSAGFEPKIAFNSGNFDVVQRLVASGVGVALIPQLAFRIPHPDVAVRRIEGARPERRIFIVTRRSGAMPAPAVENALERLRAASTRWAGRESPLHPS